MSSGFWFVDRNNREQGPVSKDDIVGMIRAGSIKRESHIWSAGLNDWRMADQVEDFAAHFLPAGPPARNLSVDPKRQALIVLQDKRAIIAALILAASFLPFVGGLAPVSIIGIHSSVTAMNQALGLMMRFGSTGRGQGAPPIGDITAALDILLALYAVPISAIVVLFAALTTGRSRFLGLSQWSDFCGVAHRHSVDSSGIGDGCASEGHPSAVWPKRQRARS